MKKLEDLAEVLVGQIMTRVAAKDGQGKEVRVVVPGAVEQGYLKEESLGTNNLIKELDPKYYTRRGDLVMKLTSDYDVAMIDETQENIVISSFIAVIRPKLMDPKYLCAVLNSEYVKKMLRSKAEGAVRPMLKVSDIRGLNIPFINQDKQEDLGKAFCLSTQKVRLLQDMKENEQAIMSAIINNSIVEALNHE